ncbi:DUF6520 family protein [Salegentibacter sp. LM13S]|uniref:DUF6520 family protein n=1 Tax=Salegentibacter lacus TaxID=2873599 RepID=UPI001CCCFD3E|nr:DUF6520 family protein [Salegentibacter lacus]MBZ9629794.1 DUF6520 family protein [Salegentibacter lacus]
MKTKVLLPMLAFICAIGMMFANPFVEADPTLDYVETENGIRSIQELECGSGDEQCRVQFSENGPIYEVYDDMNLQTPKLGSGQVIQLF